MELKKVLARLRKGRASGPDNVPPDFGAVLGRSDDALDILLRPCNQRWRSKSFPRDWSRFSVTTLFKKGGPALFANYRSISLLAIGYKVLASLTLGVEGRLRDNQFGFRRGRGADLAMLTVQRVLGAAQEVKDGELTGLLLDWSKAFDRIGPGSMQTALRRFGLPE